ncbi:MAG: hypothetical protein Q9202_005401 [Teloschistes flavicans]
MAPDRGIIDPYRLWHEYRRVKADCKSRMRLNEEHSKQSYNHHLIKPFTPLEEKMCSMMERFPDDVEDFNERLADYAHPPDKAVFDCVDEEIWKLVGVAICQGSPETALDYICRKEYRKMFSQNQFREEDDVLLHKGPCLDPSGRVLEDTVIERADQMYRRCLWWKLDWRRDIKNLEDELDRYGESWNIANEKRLECDLYRYNDRDEEDDADDEYAEEEEDIDEKAGR